MIMVTLSSFIDFLVRVWTMFLQLGHWTEAGLEPNTAGWPKATVGAENTFWL